MKKYIGIISGIMFVLSIGIAAAQITGGGIQIGTAPNGQTVVSGNISGAIGSPTNGAPVGVAGVAGIQQWQMQRQSTTADLSFVTNLLAQIKGIVGLLPPLFIGVAVVLFFWYLIRYFIVDADKADKKEGAVKGMGYSLAALFIMVSLWGILAFFGNAIGVNSNTTVNAPRLPQ